MLQRIFFLWIGIVILMIYPEKDAKEVEERLVKIPACWIISLSIWVRIIHLFFWIIEIIAMNCKR